MRREEKNNAGWKSEKKGKGRAESHDSEDLEGSTLRIIAFESVGADLTFVGDPPALAGR